MPKAKIDPKILQLHRAQYEAGQRVVCKVGAVPAAPLLVRLQQRSRLREHVLILIAAHPKKPASRGLLCIELNINDPMIRIDLAFVLSDDAVPLPL